MTVPNNPLPKTARCVTLASRAVLMLALGSSAAVAQSAVHADSAPPHPIPDTPRTPPGRPMRPDMPAFADSMENPESVLFDERRDLFYVSNINGPSLLKDGNGFIARLKGDGSRDVVRWIVSGKGGVTLHAPKGMALAGDTLWVSDIDAMRAFSVSTGAPLATVDLAPVGATFLNDVVLGPDGAVYVTDTHTRADARGNMVSAGPGRVYRIAAGGRATVALESARLAMPNGIAWDKRGSRFVIVPFGGDTVMTWRVGEAQPTPLVAGPGSFDGVVVNPDGRLFVSSKATGSVHELVGDKLVKRIEHIGDVADFEWDGKRGRLVVPLTAQNRVNFYAVPQ